MAESKRGYHFLSRYRSCPYSWYLKYIRNLEPVGVKPGLAYGLAVHKAKEMLYRNLQAGILLTSEEFLAIGLAELYKVQPGYPDQDKFGEDILRMRASLPFWYSKYAELDAASWDILLVEKEIEFPLFGEQTMTARLDLVVKEKVSGTLLAVDTKTTSFSVYEPIKAFELPGQLDAQLLALEQEYPGEYASGVIVDSLYCRKGGEPDAQRSMPLTRTREQLLDAKFSFQGGFVELGQKVAALGLRELPVPYYFDRRGESCGKFGCEFSEICMARLRDGEVPLGYRLRKTEEEDMDER